MFEAFGHSAVRVEDPVNNFDIVYNYGTFDFDQPNFYLNFAKGYLRYFLSRNNWENFEYAYRFYNRSISEQVLNLSPEKKQAFFNFLENNYLPENRYYFYDYYYDNCSTRIRDALEAVMGDSLEFGADYVMGEQSFRSMTDLYIEDTQPWGDLGIDLCLGSPIDKPISAYEYMFLPEYLAKGFGSATITYGNTKKPLVAKERTIFEADHSADAIPWFTPARLFWFLFLVILAITYFELKKGKNYYYIDLSIFFIYGFFGTIFFLIWTITDHHAAEDNYNVFWAFPLHLIFAFVFVKKQPARIFRIYLIFTCLLSLFLLLGWNFIPQHLHIAVIPLILIIFTRAAFNLIRDYRSRLI